MWRLEASLLYSLSTSGGTCRATCHRRSVERLSLPTDQSLGELLKRHGPGCSKDAGACTPGKSKLDDSGREQPSRTTSPQRGEGEQKDEASRKRGFDIYSLDGRQERKAEGRRQKGQRRWKAGQQGQGRQQEQGLLNGSENGGDEKRQKRQFEAEERSEDIEGAPGGLGSYGSCEAEDFVACVGRELVTADTAGEDPRLEFHSSGEDLGRIHFQDFSQVLEWALNALRQSRNTVQLPVAVEKPLQRTSSSDIFPLPHSSLDQPYFSSVIAGLNDLAGHPLDSGDEEPSDVCVEIKKGLRRIVDRFDVWSSSPPVVSFQKLFTTKDIDYMGEEIKVGQSLSWTAVKKSLPDGVGQLPLQDFCRLGTLEYVQNFEKHLLPEDVVQVPRAPKVMVEHGSWDDLCSGLVSKHICEIWPVDELYHWKGVPLLNGLFAVGKGEFEGGIETQRLIMNLTPTNSLCRSLAGDVSTLPGLSGFSGFLLESDEVAIFSSEDIRCFFYLFSIPQEWKRFMGFNKLVSPNLVPLEFKGRPCVLVSRVLPMGFVNSVSIAQHVHRNVVRWATMLNTTPGGGEAELRKDKPASSAKSLFHIYLDNYDLIEKVDPRTADLVRGAPSAQVLQLRQVYEALGLPRHPKKSVERELKAEIQGALFDGKLVFAMAKPEKVWRYALLEIELWWRE